MAHLWLISFPTQIHVLVDLKNCYLQSSGVQPAIRSSSSRAWELAPDTKIVRFASSFYGLLAFSFLPIDCSILGWFCDETSFDFALWYLCYSFLTSNYFTGEIPATFSKLASLKDLWVLVLDYCNKIKLLFAYIVSFKTHVHVLQATWW